MYLCSTSSKRCYGDSLINQVARCFSLQNFLPSFLCVFFLTPPFLLPTLSPLRWNPEGTPLFCTGGSVKKMDKEGWSFEGPICRWKDGERIFSFFYDFNSGEVETWIWIPSEFARISKVTSYLFIVHPTIRYYFKFLLKLNTDRKSCQMTRQLQQTH